MHARAGVALVLAALMAVVGLTGCAPQGPQPPDTPAAHAEFGPPAKPDGSKITLQDDVVVVGGGRNAVWAIGNHGFDVTLDAHADGMSSLQVGKVLLATAFAVGRVATMQQSGDRTEVLLAPVQLTDLVKNGTIAGATDYSPDDMTFSDGLNGSAPTLTRADTSGPSIRPVANVHPAAVARPMPGIKTSAGSLLLAAEYDASGVTFSVGVKPSTLKLAIDVKLLFTKVTVHSSTTIKDGKVASASTDTTGIKGLQVGLGAGSSAQGGATETLKVLMPVATKKQFFTVYGIPMFWQLKTTLGISFALVGKNTTITASAQWDFDQRITATSGGAQASAPTGFRTQKSLLDSINGIALGGAVLNLSADFKFVIGIGIPVVGAGGYGKVAYSVGVGLGSALGSPIAVCRKGVLEVKAGVGAGIDVDLPSSLKTALGKTAIGKLLANTNEIPIGEWMKTLLKKQQTIPDKAICGAG